MQNRSRIDKSIVNSSIALASEVVILLAKFLIQSVFVKTLGAQYLGANGLFSNILSFLSFAELGIGTAITYSLYKPLADGDKKEIAAVMGLFKTAYNIIGVVIFIIGSVFSLFLPYFINKGTGIPNIKLMFLLYLLNSAISYFFTYKRTLLIANQLGYLDNLNRLVFTFFQTIIQVAFLIFTHQYVTYLIIQVISTLLSNISISRKADKIFPYLNSYDNRVSGEKKRAIGKNVLGAVASKIGTIVANGTDNILLSKFIGLAIVGVYSNYMLILTSIQNIVNQMLNAVIASIANFSNTESEKREISIFYDYLFLVAMVAFVLSGSVYLVIQYFIKFWLGKAYVLNEFAVFLMVINWFVNMLRSSILGFMDVHGLYWETRWKSIVESVINLGVGLTLIAYFHLGVISVVIGTLSANIFVNMWWEPLILLKKISTSFGQYYRKYFYYLLTNFLLILIIFWCHSYEIIEVNNFLEFVIYGVSAMIILFFIFLLLNIKTSELKFYVRILKRKISQI